MSTLLENLQAAEAVKMEAAQQAYSDLVVQLAAGTEDPTLPDVQQILAAAGKSASGLTDDVATQKCRDALRDKIAESEAALIEQSEILDKKADATTALEAATENYRQTVWPLDQRLQEITQLVMESHAARGELIKTCNDESLAARESSIRHKVEHQNKLVQDQRKLVSAIKQNLESLKQKCKASDPAVVAKQQRYATESEKLKQLCGELDEAVAESNQLVEDKIEA